MLWHGELALDLSRLELLLYSQDEDVFSESYDITSSNTEVAQPEQNDRKTVQHC